MERSGNKVMTCSYDTLKPQQVSPIHRLAVEVLYFSSSREADWIATPADLANPPECAFVFQTRIYNLFTVEAGIKWMAFRFPAEDTVDLFVTCGEERHAAGQQLMLEFSPTTETRMSGLSLNWISVLVAYLPTRSCQISTCSIRMYRAEVGTRSTIQMRCKNCRSQSLRSFLVGSF